MRLGSITVARRFRGPPHSANGGYIAGRLAAFVDGPAEIALRSPPPLETEMTVVANEADTVNLLDGDQIVATARAWSRPSRSRKPISPSPGPRWRAPFPPIATRCRCVSSAVPTGRTVFASSRAQSTRTMPGTDHWRHPGYRVTTSWTNPVSSPGNSSGPRSTARPATPSPKRGRRRRSCSADWRWRSPVVPAPGRRAWCWPVKPGAMAGNSSPRRRCTPAKVPPWPSPRLPGCWSTARFGFGASS